MSNPLSHVTKEAIQEAVEPRIVIDEETGCWNWDGRVDRNGYSVLSVRNKDGYKQTFFNGHRIMYRAFVAPIEDAKLVISHKCHNRKCINPDHLDLVTQAENVQEQIARGTHVSQIVPRRRLTDQQRSEIYQLLIDGQSNYAISQLYNITMTNVARYKKNLPKWILEQEEPNNETDDSTPSL